MFCWTIDIVYLHNLWSYSNISKTIIILTDQNKGYATQYFSSLLWNQMILIKACSDYIIMSDYSV